MKNKTTKTDKAGSPKKGGTPPKKNNLKKIGIVVSGKKSRKKLRNLFKAAKRQCGLVLIRCIVDNGEEAYWNDIFEGVSSICFVS